MRTWESPESVLWAWVTPELESVVLVWRVWESPASGSGSGSVGLVWRAWELPLLGSATHLNREN